MREETATVPQSAPLHQQVPESAHHGFTYYLDLISRRLHLFLSVLIITALLLFITGETARPVYQSSATILVNRHLDRVGSDLLFNPSTGNLATRPFLANHIEILKSRTLAKMVIDTLPEELRQELLRSTGTAGAGSANDRAVELLAASVTARAVRDADIIKISVNAPSRRLAVELTRAYVAAYQAWTLERNRADIRAIKEFVFTQLQNVTARLDSAERALEDYKQNIATSDLSTQAKALIERQSAVLALYEQTRTQLAGLQKEISILAPLVDSAPAASNPLALVTTMNQELVRLETERTSLLLQGYDSLHPRIVLLNQRIGEIQQQTRNLIPAGVLPAPLNVALPRYLEITTEIARLNAQANTLRQSIATYEQELARLPTAERQLARYTRDVEVARQLHSLLELKFEEARIQEAGRLSAVGLIDEPAPAKKIRPSHLKNLLTALFLGFALAFGTTVVVERLDTLVRHPEDLERRAWTIIGSIPRINPGATLNPGEVAEEQFRILRTNLSFLSADKPLRTIVVSSPSPSEGKSTIATNLALTLARSGKKVILLDCDLRKPVLHRIFNQRRKPGITDVVLLGVPLNSALYQPGPDLPDILFAGTTPPSPVDFLTAAPFINFLKNLKNTYEFIIIDTPPILVSTDAPAVATNTDGIILVSRMGQTDIRALAEAKKVLQHAQVRILGVVANGLKPRRHYGYYRYKYRYYHYRYAAEGSTRR